uniref:Uncharacterized protein n=1 Tax=Octopus bimaculoides TaxID=37653 RepID=A0A0L8FXU0_OCTBM
MFMHFPKNTRSFSEVSYNQVTTSVHQKYISYYLALTIYIHIYLVDADNSPIITNVGFSFPFITDLL